MNDAPHPSATASASRFAPASTWTPSGSATSIRISRPITAIAATVSGPTARFTTIAHADHLICSPLFPETVDRWIEGMVLAPGARALDVGCGKGELLVRVAARWTARGVGIDPNPSFLAEARAKSAARLPAGA